MATSASIYFFAGEFADVLRRYGDGADQIYASHDEVAKLIDDCQIAGVQLAYYGFNTPGTRQEFPTV